MTKILALDQASRTTGWAIFEDEKLIDFGHFTFEDPDMGDRLVKIRNKVLNLIKDNNIDIVLFEDIQYEYANPSTFKILAEVFGVINELVSELNIEHEIIFSGSWKSSLGIKGKKRTEQKQQAKDFVIKTYLISPTQDECDAICIGTHFNRVFNSEHNWD